MDYKLKKAQELCKYCKTKGLPGIQYSLNNGPYIFVHKFLDAAGSGDYEACQADGFLKRYNAFIGEKEY